MVAGEPMSVGFKALSEKEKQTLRLMVRGHDAKSIARHLGLSVHTINERLRDARRKLEVSSSREAARLLLDSEANAPQNLVDKQIREAGPAAHVGQAAASGALKGLIAGIVTLSIMIGMLALSLIADGTTPSATTTAGSVEAIASAATGESEVVRSAREWLVLGDQGRWKDGWLGTATSFRTVNSAKKWAEVQEQVRVPLGAVVSRTALSQENVPAPPAGVEVVKFRTSFANKAEVTETLTLVREDGAWRVAGCMIG